MDREVSRTLAELERKLHELERALSARGDPPDVSPARHATVAPPQAPEQGGVRLVDEGALQYTTGGREPPPGHGASPQQPAPDYLRAPEPSAASAQPPPEQDGPAGESDGTRAAGHWQPPAQPSRAAWQPTSPTGPAAASPQRHAYDETIDLAELTRFRDRLEQTMRELIAEYDRIILLRRAPDPSAPGSR